MNKKNLTISIGLLVFAVALAGVFTVIFGEVFESKKASSEKLLQQQLLKEFKDSNKTPNNVLESTPVPTVAKKDDVPLPKIDLAPSNEVPLVSKEKDILDFETEENKSEILEDNDTSSINNTSESHSRIVSGSGEYILLKPVEINEKLENVHQDEYNSLRSFAYSLLEKLDEKVASSFFADKGENYIMSSSEMFQILGSLNIIEKIKESQDNIEAGILKNIEEMEEKVLEAKCTEKYLKNISENKSLVRKAKNETLDIKAGNHILLQIELYNLCLKNKELF